LFLKKCVEVEVIETVQDDKVASAKNKQWACLGFKDNKKFGMMGERRAVLGVKARWSQFVGAFWEYGIYWKRKR
jgi:hypothetical protein